MDETVLAGDGVCIGRNRLSGDASLIPVLSESAAPGPSIDRRFLGDGAGESSITTGAVRVGGAGVGAVGAGTVRSAAVLMSRRSSTRSDGGAAAPEAEAAGLGLGLDLSLSLDTRPGDGSDGVWGESGGKEFGGVERKTGYGAAAPLPPPPLPLPLP